MVVAALSSVQGHLRRAYIVHSHLGSPCLIKIPLQYKNNHCRGKMAAGYRLKAAGLFSGGFSALARYLLMCFLLVVPFVQDYFIDVGGTGGHLHHPCPRPECVVGFTGL
jgi:hypothetical protein